MQQLRIRLELWRPAIELPRMAQHHATAPMHPLHSSTHMHIRIAKLLQLAHIRAIFPQTHNREPAFFIPRLRPAHIQKARSICLFNHVKDVNLDTHIFMGEFRRCFRRNAIFWLCRKAQVSGNAKNQQNPRTTETHKSLSGKSGHRLSFAMRPIKCRHHTTLA